MHLSELIFCMLLFKESWSGKGSWIEIRELFDDWCRMAASIELFFIKLYAMEEMKIVLFRINLSYIWFISDKFILDFKCGTSTSCHDSLS